MVSTFQSICGGLLTLFKFLISVTITCPLLQSIENNDPGETVNALSRTAMFLPMYFLICNYGEKVSTAFDNLNETVYGMKWHMCPNDLQKYLVMMLASLQQPVVMKGVFSLDSSRSTFKRVSFALIFHA